MSTNPPDLSKKPGIPEVLDFNDSGDGIRDITHTYEAKPREQPEDARLRRHKSLAMFWVGMGFFVGSSALATYCCFHNEEHAKWGRSVLTLYGGLIVGYLVGKK